MNMRLFALQRISYDGSTTPANRFSTAYRNGGARYFFVTVDEILFD